MSLSSEIKVIRDKILEKYEASEDPDIFHKIDLESLRNDDRFIERYLIYNDNDEKLTTKQLWQALIWRKEFGVHDMTEEKIPKKLLENSILFFNGRDIEGRLIIMCQIKNHRKGIYEVEDLKKNLVYWMERGIRQEKGRRMVLLFDLLGSGIANIDMDFILAMLNTLKNYYPETMKWILVYEMPWVMNATFQLIKKLLNRKTVEVLKFVDTKGIRKYIDEDNIPSAWGGRNSYEFKFVSESCEHQKEPQENEMTSIQQNLININNNNNSEKLENLNNSVQRKVHFANNLSHTPSPIDETISSFANDMLQVTPAETIVFQKNTENELFGNVHILNISKKPITYKVKTTAPDKFRVRPSSGTISPMASASINVVVQKGHQLQPMNKDKFLVMALPLPENEALTNDEITNLWKGVNAGSPEVEQHRLKCTVPAHVAASFISGIDIGINPVESFITDSYIASTSAPSMSHNGTKNASVQVVNHQLQASISQLNESVKELNNQIKSQQSLQWITIFVFIMISIAMVYILKMEIQNANSQYCIDNDHPTLLHEQSSISE